MQFQCSLNASSTQIKCKLNASSMQVKCKLDTDTHLSFLSSRGKSACYRVEHIGVHVLCPCRNEVNKISDKI